MTNKKTMTNLEIFNAATALVEAFKSADELKFPVKVNFFLQKNMNHIVELAQDIEKSRSEIIRKYGKEDENGQVSVPDENVEDATKELNDLFSLEQEVSVNMLELDWFDKIDLTAQQVSAISFMINDED